MGVSIPELEVLPGGVPDISASNAADTGPTQENGPDFRASASPARTPVIGLFLGPGMGRVKAHVTVLRELEKAGVKVHVVSGLGMGAVVAAFHALGLSPDEIEWALFRFFREAENEEPFSEAWESLAKDILLEAFKEKKIQELQKTLLIPVHDKASGEILYIKRGEIGDPLLSNISFSENHRYTTALGQKVYNAKQLRAFGADLVIGVDLLSQGIKLDRPAGFLLGLFGREATEAERMASTFDSHISLPLADWAMEKHVGPAPTLVKVAESAYELALAVQATIEEWMKRKTKKAAGSL